MKKYLILFIISCNTSITNPSPNNDIINYNELNKKYSTMDLYFEKNADGKNLVMKNKNYNINEYISYNKISDEISLISDENNGYIKMIYINDEKFPSEIEIPNGDKTIKGNVLNYDIDKQTFDVSWIDNGTEIMYFKDVKIGAFNNNIIFDNNLSDNIAESMFISANVSQSLKEYAENMPMTRGGFWDFLKFVLVIDGLILVSIL